MNGTLVPAQTLGFDATYPIVWDGYASADFTKFSVIDSTPVDTIRIRILDPNFNVIASRLVTDINLESPFGNIFGGTFSQDNHYVLVAYSVAVAPFTGPYFTNVLLLDATNPALPTVASTVIAGYSYEDPLLFTLTDSNGNRNLYFTFVSTQLDPISGDYEPPYFSQVYGVDPTTGTISLIDQVQLPKFAENSVFVRASGKEALITHGGQCTVNPDPSLPTIYTVIDASMIGDLPPDYNAVRIFRFDGKTLNLVMKQQTNCCSDLLVWPPSDGTSYFLAQSIEVFNTPGDPTSLFPSYQEVWAFFDLMQGASGLTLRPQSGPLQDVTKPAASVFSQDGQWLLRVGTYGYIDGVTPLPDTWGLKNIALFKVTPNIYQPIGINS